MKKDLTMSLPERIKMLRLEAGKSQKKLASELGISRSCLANYETGRREPDHAMLIRLADSFHVMTDYLINRCDNRSLDLSAQEVKEALALSYRLQNRGTTLDITALTEEERLAMLTFYDYIKRKEVKEREKVT